MIEPRAGRTWMSLGTGKSLLISAVTLIIGLSLTACELTRFDPPLSSTVGGLTRDKLRLIQRDARLTTDQKRQQIRDAIGVPDTDEGNRLANFLLNLTIA